MSVRRWVALGACLGITGPLVAAEPAALPQTAPAPATAAPVPSTAAPAVPCPPEPLVTAACNTLCGPPGRVWVTAEWLYFAASGNPLPALATASPPGTSRAAAGVLGVPGTTVAIGGNRANTDFRNGLRLNAGIWLNEDQTWGVSGDFFFLGRTNETFVAGSNGTSIISRPFFNGVTGVQDSELVSFPGALAGSVTVGSSSDVIGGGFNMLCNICCGPDGRFDMLNGFTYLNLRDNLSITENLTALAGSGVPAGTSIIVNDRFKTNNNFYGYNIGGQFEKRFGRVFVGGTASIALGVSHQEVTVSGSTAITPPGGVTTVAPGGLLAQTSNIGRYTNDEFAVIPQVGVRVGAQLTDRVRAFVGYNFLYWSSVVRAGDQIDLRVNPNLIPPQTLPVVGPQVPAPRTVTTDFWLQGISVGGTLLF